MMCKKLCFPLLIGLLFAACSKCPTLPVPEGDSNRIVLAELFSFVECTFCPNAEEAIHRLKSEYGDSLAVLVYHMRLLGDTLSPEDAQARAHWYGVSAAPTSFFDGGSKFVGANTVEYAYNNYKDIIVTRRSIPSPLQMSMDLLSTPSDVQIDCEVVALDEASGDLKLWSVIFENSVGLDDSKYDFVVRWIEEKSLSFSGSDTFRTTFAFLNPWQSGELGAVAFVQNDDTKEVLQATIKEMASPSLHYDFELVCLDDTFQTVSADTEAVFRFTLENSGTLNDVYELSLSVADTAQGSFENYCRHGVCLLPFAVCIDTLSAGETDSTISVHFMPMRSPGLEAVQFRVKSLGDTTLVDSIFLYIQAEGGLDLVKSENMRFSNPVLEGGKTETKIPNSQFQNLTEFK